jgi:hypothetical protein
MHLYYDYNAVITYHLIEYMLFIYFNDTYYFFKFLLIFFNKFKVFHHDTNSNLNYQL